MPYFKDTENKPHFMDDAAFVHLLPAGCVQITNAEANALRNPAPTSAQLLAAFKQSARSALDATSVTMERIVEGVSLGNTSFAAADVVAWMDYRKALRASLSATAVGTLPAKPAYPAGT